MRLLWGKRGIQWVALHPVVYFVRSAHFLPDSNLNVSYLEDAAKSKMRQLGISDEQKHWSSIRDLKILKSTPKTGD